VFLTRGIGALMSLNGTKNQLKMQEVQTEVAKIKARYSKYDLKVDKKMKQKQQTEIMALYKKNDVNPMGSLGTIFVTMPIFISL
jgi:YidC/Oxa1 family membrane protein insertase